jgi:predicted ATP-dependent Lon-type protease
MLIDMQSEQLYEPDEGEKIKSEITDEDYLNDWVDSIQ